LAFWKYRILIISGYLQTRILKILIFYSAGAVLS
jgi:hypothetical protein